MFLKISKGKTTMHKKVLSILLVVCVLFTTIISALVSNADEKQMNKLIRTATSENKIALELADGTLEADTEYTVEIEFRMFNRVFNENVSFILFGDTDSTNTPYANKLLYKSSDISYRGTKFPTINLEGTKATYTFTLTQEQIDLYDKFYLGFYFEKVATGTPAGEIYVGDFTLYESDNANKTNLLPSDRSNKNWYTDYAKCSTSSCQLLTYEDIYFITRPMNKLTRTATSENKLALELADGTLKADTEYTVEFEYKIFNREFNKDVSFILFGDTDSTNTPYANKLLYKSSDISYRGTKFPTINLEETKATYTFTLTQEQIDLYQKFYLGFYFEKVATGTPAAEIYVGDFTLHESDDADKTNLLPFDRSLNNWYTDSSKCTKNNCEVSERDEFMFIGKRMNKLVRSYHTENHIVLELADGTLKADKEYTVNFEYYIKNRTYNQDVSFVLFGDTDASNTTYGNKILFGSSGKSGRGKLFSNPQIVNDVKATYSFTLTQDQIDTYEKFYLGFYFEKVASGSPEAEVYVGEFELYETEDTAKKNLLPRDRSNNNWYNTNAQCSTTHCEWLAYDEMMFIGRRMNKLVRSYYTESHIVLELANGTFEADKEYTVNFEYYIKNRTYNEDVSFVLFGDSDTSNTTYGNKILFGSSGKSGRGQLFSNSQIVGDVNAAYSFKLTQDQIDTYEKFYIGFYFEKVDSSTPAAEVYVGDFTLYASEDIAKTNLLPRDRSNNNWYTASSKCTATNCEWLSYDELMFIGRRMNKLIRSYHTENQIILELADNTLQADKDYTVNFEYYIENRTYNKDVSFVLFGDTDADDDTYGNKILFGSMDKVGRGTLFSNAKVEADVKATYSFKLTQEQIDTYEKFYLGFYFEKVEQGTPAAEVYVGDFTLYESNDTNETNLLPRDRSNNNWYTVSSKCTATNCEWLSYDELMFMGRRMNKLIRSYHTENQIILELADNTLQADKDYTVNFEFKINNRTYNKDVCFVLFGDSDASNGTYGNKILFSSTGKTGRGELFTDGKVIGGAEATYSFRLTAEQLATYEKFYLGFYFEKVAEGTPQAEVYVGEFTLYESDNTAKTNLLPRDRSNKNWYNVTGRCSVSNCEYLPYEADMFARLSMLNINRVEGMADSLKLKIPASTIKANTNYSVTFKYQFNGSTYNEDAYFALFGESAAANYGDKIIFASKKIGNEFASEKTLGSTVTYTFELTDAELAKYTDLYVGFYFPVSDKNAEIFVTDFSLYESLDETKANLLSKNSRANNMTDWYTDTLVGAEEELAGAKYVVLDESVFIEKQMIKLVRTATAENRLMVILSDNTILPDTEYVVKFKYNIQNRDLNKNVSFVIYGDTDMSNSSYGNKIIHSSSGIVDRGTLFPSINSLGDVDVTYKFKLTADEIAKYEQFFLGFYFEKVPEGTPPGEIYMSDFTLTKATDTTNTNLLPNDMSNRNWYHTGGKCSDTQVSLLPYDGSLFVPKTMLHIVGTAGEASTLKVKIPTNKLKADTQYTVSFKHQFNNRKYNENVYFALFGKEPTSAKYGESVVYASSVIGSSFATSKTIGSTENYTFMLSAAQLAKYEELYVGFYFDAGNTEWDAYVKNFVLYENADEDKTNLLTKSAYASDMRDWFTDTEKGSGVEFANSSYEIDDDTVFVEKTMLYVNRPTNTVNTLKQKVKTGALKANTEYTFTFKYHFINRGMDNKVYAVLFGERYTDNESFGDSNIFGSSMIGSAFEYADTDGVTATYTFTLSEEHLEKYSDFCAGFYYAAEETDAEFYIADMVLYKSSDKKKTNLLVKDEYANEMSGWYNDASVGGGLEFAHAKYMPYDSSLFPQKTMLHITWPKNQTGILAQKIPLGALKADTEYTVTFKFNFANGSMGKNLDFAIFGETTKKGYADSVIFGANGTSFISTKFIKNTMWYTFKLSQEDLEKYSDLYAGFNVSSGSKATDVYIADFALYESSDNTQTNLLAKDIYATDMEGWFTSASVGEGKKFANAQYEDFEKKKFPDITIEDIDDGAWWDPNDYSGEEVGYAKVKGRLVDNLGNPIAKVRLELVSASRTYRAVTNSKGYFTFNNVVVDFYELFIITSDGQRRSTGYYSSFEPGDVATINLTYDPTNTNNFIQEDLANIGPCGRLVGTVYTPDLKIVPGIKIYLRGFGETVTDEKGTFRFVDVPVGEYDLYTVLEDGSEYIFRKVTVKENVELEMKLKYDILSTNDSQALSALWIWIIAAASVLLLAAVVVVIVILFKKRKIAM